MSDLYELNNVNSSDCYENTNLPTIPEFYNGKNILITGGTGFLGKVLIEKLLRSCAGLNKIYLLMRSKRNKSIDDRIDDMLTLPLFKVVQKQYASMKVIRNKIVGLNFEMDKLQLGLSTDSIDQLKNVSIIYHVAATVRFDEPLRNAILMNTRMTHEMIKFAKQLDHLDVFIHVSTAYCNIQHNPLEEKLYEPTIDWRLAIKIAEERDDELLNILSDKVTHPFPNTYTFSKHLSEHVVNDERNNLPLVIVRPSIVTATVYEPITGWIDNMNGPFTFLFAAGSGIIRSTFLNVTNRIDYVPVDDVIKSMLIASWKHGTKKELNNTRTNLPIYNITALHPNYPVSQEVIRLLDSCMPYAPPDFIIGYSPCFGTTCKFKYLLKVYGIQIPQAFLMDLFSKLFNKKLMFVKLQRKIMNSHHALRYFMDNQWDFITTNNEQLINNLYPSDVENFNNKLFGKKYFEEYMLWCALGFRRFVLHQKDEDLPKARINYKRIKVTEIMITAIIYMILFYFLFKHIIATLVF